MEKNAIFQLLNSLSINDDKRQNALIELERAIIEFRRSLVPNVSQTRKELQKLQISLEKAIEQIQAFSPETIQYLCDTTNHSKGKVTSILKEVNDEIKEACKLANKAPNKSHNSRLIMLAYRVAFVLKNLGVNTSRTRDGDDTISGAKGGAAYAKLLRLVIKSAGETPPDDLYPLMDKALNLLDNPNGDFL